MKRRRAVRKSKGNFTVLLASGGLDSTVLYYYLLSKGHTVKVINFAYGSKHNKSEREAVERNISSDIKFINIDLKFLHSALVRDEMSVPAGNYNELNMQNTVVPFRNAIMLSYAIAYADDMGFNNVALSNHSGDHFIYHDCRPKFIKYMNKAANAGTKNNISVISPFLNIDKSGIVRIGVDLGITDIMFNTWTCYDNGKYHCGVCGACRERKEAFALNKLIDKTIYNK